MRVGREGVMVLFSDVSQVFSHLRWSLPGHLVAPDNGSLALPTPSAAHPLPKQPLWPAVTSLWKLMLLSSGKRELSMHSRCKSRLQKACSIKEMYSHISQQTIKNPQWISVRYGACLTTEGELMRNRAGSHCNQLCFVMENIYQVLLHLLILLKVTW